MRPYSLDLRERVATAVDRHEGTLEEIADRFRVSVSFISRLLRKRRQTGSLDPRPHGGGQPSALAADDRERLRELVQGQPDATLAELQQRCGLPCSHMAVWRALQKLRLPRKKKTLHAQERDRPDVQARRDPFQQQLTGLDPQRLVFVDETGATTDMTRRYGRAPRGERVVGAVPGRWKSVSLVGAVRLVGIAGALMFPGATDTMAFRTYVEGVLLPQLRPGDIVLWDNLKPHQDSEVLGLLERAGVHLVPLPPYSPDLNPIEKMWSKVKEYLRSCASRTVAKLYEAIAAALKAVSLQDIRGWFQSCGLCATQA